MARLWHSLTRQELAGLRELGALVVIPTGATEQHGDHLPVGCDTLLSAAVAERAAERAGVPVVVAPAVASGFSPHHGAWAGTLSLRLTTYLAVLHDLARSVLDTGFNRVLFVNGHGGNEAPLRSLIGEMVTDGHAVGAVNYFAPSQADWVPMLKGGLDRAGHACEYETALLMALGLVDENAGQGYPPRCTQPWMASDSAGDPITTAGAIWPPVFQPDDCGYYGDPGAADLRNGEAMLEVTVARLAAFYDDFARAPLRTGKTGGMAPLAG
ncbi:creatininase [Salipiger pallidus]|uniref:Creatininase n=1 Tax=Salipiger pallidus TaxID=1775170 RepID=A0A8J2ZKN2_9RHOB|nr:creatininase family protein [Salipiger pallidus]GGG76349.1 creatininase [Salipiger pallidus]